jgi:hypothetical protein
VNFIGHRLMLVWHGHRELASSSRTSTASGFGANRPPSPSNLDNSASSTAPAPLTPEDGFGHAIGAQTSSRAA